MINFGYMKNDVSAMEVNSTTDFGLRSEIEIVLRRKTDIKAMLCDNPVSPDNPPRAATRRVSVTRRAVASRAVGGRVATPAIPKSRSGILVRKPFRN